MFFNDTLRVDTQGGTCEVVCPNTSTGTPFAPRAHHTATVVGEKLWLIGGCDIKYVNPPPSLAVSFKPAVREGAAATAPWLDTRCAEIAPRLL